MTTTSSTPKPRPHQRIGLFGILGAGNLGNDGSMESLLNYIRTAHPDAAVDAMCSGPDRMRSVYGVAATPLHWDREFLQQTSKLRTYALTVLGKAIDVFRTMSWVRRHDVVIVPGAGVLEASLPVRPWEIPYSMFLLCASGRLFGTKVALVNVGADVINKRVTRWLSNSAARLANYRSYRDALSRDALTKRGIDTSSDPIYPDLVFGIPTPPGDQGDPQLVGVGVMEYYGSNDDRRAAEEIHAAYVAKMKLFVRWLVDSGRRVRLFVGDELDERVAQDIVADFRAYRPDLQHDHVISATVTSMRALVDGMSLVNSVVAIRYHNVMCALKLSKPTISLSYSAKHDVLMEEMGLSGFSQPAATFQVDQLIRQFVELESRSADLRQTMTERNAARVSLLDQQFSYLSTQLFRPSRAAELRAETQPVGANCGVKDFPTDKREPTDERPRYG